MTEGEITEDYERHTGEVAVECFETRGFRPEHVPGVLVRSHGPFAWGKDAFQAVHNAVVLEEVAMMAFYTQILKGDREPMPQVLLDKHFLRKHGAHAYYGQKR